MSLYCLDNHRTPEQLEEMRRLEAAGICLFCPDGLRSHPTQRIIRETAHWHITPNAYPYKGTAVHLLLVPHEHVTDLADLSEPARLDFFQALQWVRNEYDLTYYGLGIRNGDCRYTGGTIAHVHVHLLVGDTTPDSPPVRFRFSS
ncbi:Diadenosine tetraphosphate (Ap4A) hydrolase [Thermomonospora echinospora]|uniref:Diadenosine tetraphosphate (Ap4A) hydrolase n=1 Tax=Thermomonospora echinospora TaxID=1992 RepID=A0A1H6DX20_9ACTN|nr:HIT domain-containing protein [Thermomonospora echinospora]SEG89624.1 Diadenosine tetraphosphate (Ap4A) hydrolase [Thermomonospora echinospora]